MEFVELVELVEMVESVEVVERVELEGERGSHVDPGRGRASDVASLVSVSEDV